MSEALPHPEDPSRWPSDPWKLLGVSQKAGRREVRRAYARLIRIYKPEHKPTEFRLIRDAYERIDSLLEFREASEAGATGESAAEDFHGREEIAFPPTNVGPSDSCDRAEQTGAAEIDRLWQDASNSTESLAAAYGAYRAKFETGASDEDLCLRLYWLLRLWPRLDDASDCRDWLVRGMARHESAGRLLELYHREVLRVPEEALSDRALELAKTSRTPQRRWRLLAMRWQAASRLGRRDVIPADLEWARAAAASEPPEVWCRVLLMAADHLAWESTGPLYDLYHACRREVAATPDAHLHLEYELDRSDHLSGLAFAWREMQGLLLAEASIVRPLAALVEQSWTQPFSRVRVPLINLLALWLTAPAETIDQLGELNTDAWLVLHHLAALVDALYRDRCSSANPPTAESLADYVRNLLWLARGEPYGESRRRLFSFCLQRRVTTEQLFAAIAYVMSRDRTLVSDILANLQRDIVLNLMAKAALAVWPETHGDAGAGQGGRP